MQEAPAGVSHPVILLHSASDLRELHLCSDGGIRYMCLRCDMLLLVPGFAFTMALESDSLTRLLSPHQILSLLGPSDNWEPARGEARLRQQRLEPLLLKTHRSQL